jgi:nucleoside-diphosphate-sugar epimerase
MRDFIHIDDCVRGILHMTDQINDGGAVNLSTGLLTSFIELAQTVADIVGYYPEVCGISDMPEGVFASRLLKNQEKDVDMRYVARIVV